MTSTMTFENADAVVLYKENEDGSGVEAFSWNMIEKKTKTYFEAQGVRFSYKTGKPIANQPDDCGFVWRWPTSHSEKRETHQFKDIVVKAEPFDLNDLETISIDKQKVELEIDDEQTVEEMLSDIRQQFDNENIPFDARIVRVEGNEVWVSYERPETLVERASRLYRQPALEREKAREEREKLEARRQVLLDELGNIDEQIG